MTTKSQPEGGKPETPFFGWKDVRACCLLVALLPVSWLIPERHWKHFVRLLVLVRRTILRDRSTSIEHIRDMVGNALPAMDASDVVDNWHVHSFTERLQTLRCYRPGGWQPALRLTGQKHVDEAVRQGRGAILWFAPSVHYKLPPKMALAMAGYRFDYLSKSGHGFSDTRWGTRFLNPIQVKVENRLLCERIVIWPGAEREAFDRLKTRLDQFKMVGITALGAGRRSHWIPTLDGRIRFATAPAALALRMNLPLIPVLTARQRDGSYAVTVEAPLNGEVSGDMAADIDAMLSRFGRIMEEYALSYPDQFWWSELTSRG